MSLIELARYTGYIDAEIARSRLEAEGIHAVCFDSAMNVLEGVPLIFPVRLMILAEDRDEALTILGDAIP